MQENVIYRECYNYTLGWYRDSYGSSSCAKGFRITKKSRDVFIIKWGFEGVYVFFMFCVVSKIYEKSTIFQKAFSIVRSYFVHKFWVQGGHRVINFTLRTFSFGTFFSKIGVQGAYNVVCFYVYVYMFEMSARNFAQGGYRGNTEKF